VDFEDSEEVIISDEKDVIFDKEENESNSGATSEDTFICFKDTSDFSNKIDFIVNLLVVSIPIFDERITGDILLKEDGLDVSAAPECECAAVAKAPLLLNEKYYIAIIVHEISLKVCISTLLSTQMKIRVHLIQQLSS
jgi:hypothetical protein